MLDTSAKRLVEPPLQRLRLPLELSALGVGVLAVGWFVSHGHAGLAGAAILAVPAFAWVAAAPARGLELALLVVLLTPPQTVFGFAQLGSMRLAGMLVMLALLLDLRASPHVSRLRLVDWAAVGLVAMTLLSWWLGPREPHSLRLVGNYLLPIIFFAGGRRFAGRTGRRLHAVAFVGTALASLTVLYEAFVAHRPLFSDPTSYYWLGSANSLFRPGGVFGSPPAAATVLAMVIPCGLLLVQRARGARRLALLSLLAVSFAALFVTYTRGPEIGLIVGVLVYAVLLGPATWARYAYATALAAVIVSVVLLPRVESSGWFQQGVVRQGTLASREAFWHEARHVITDSTRHKLLGHGPASLEVGLPWLPGNPEPDIAIFPDLTFKGLQNEYLRILVELGAIGLALFLGWIGGTIVGGARAAFRDTPHRREIAAGVAGCVAFAVTSLVGDTLWETQVFAVVALLSGVVISLASNRPDEESGT